MPMRREWNGLPFCDAELDNPEYLCGKVKASSTAAFLGENGALKANTDSCGN
jgi:hypothetical protein